MSADNPSNSPADTRFRPVGTGMMTTRNCLRGNHWVSRTGGGKLRNGFWMCAECVAKADARKVAA